MSTELRAALGEEEARLLEKLELESQQLLSEAAPTREYIAAELLRLRDEQARREGSPGNEAEAGAQQRGFRKRSRSRRRANGCTGSEY